MLWNWKLRFTSGSLLLVACGCSPSHCGAGGAAPASCTPGSPSTPCVPAAQVEGAAVRIRSLAGDDWEPAVPQRNAHESNEHSISRRAQRVGGPPLRHRGDAPSRPTRRRAAHSRPSTDSTLASATFPRKLTSFRVLWSSSGSVRARTSQWQQLSVSSSDGWVRWRQRSSRPVERAARHSRVHACTESDRRYGDGGTLHDRTGVKVVEACRHASNCPPMGQFGGSLGTKSD